MLLERVSPDSDIFGGGIALSPDKWQTVFELTYLALLGKRHGVMVNSGSSAMMAEEKPERNCWAYCPQPRVALKGRKTTVIIAFCLHSSYLAEASLNPATKPLLQR